MDGKLMSSLKAHVQERVPESLQWVKVEYVVAALFLILALAVIWSRKLIVKGLVKLFLKDGRLSKKEKSLIHAAYWASYLLALLMVNGAVLQLNLPPNVQKVVNLLFFLLYTFILTVIAIKVLDLLVETFAEGVKKKVTPSERPLVDTYYSMISKILNVFVVIVAIIAVLDRLGFNVTSLITSLGVGSLAVGLAAKDTIKNFISGILLVTDRQFRIGDRVYIRDIGVEGYVHDIGLRTTRIVTISGNNLITVPNSKLTEGIIENALYPEPKVKDSVEVGVAYGSDVEKVKELLLKATEGVKGILKEPPPSVYFINFGDSSLLFKLIYYVESKEVAFSVKSKVHENVKKLFEANGVEIPFPQNDLWFRNPLRVELNGAVQRKDEKL
jgi:small-conductance mechanosensitive channel